MDICLLLMLRIMQVAGYTKGRSLVQRSPSEYVCVTECYQMQQ